MNNSGRFITFEGIDGAGKSSHLARVVALLRARGLTVVQTREPGGTPLGEQLRNLVLSQSMSRDTEALLVFASRREHLESVIWPALERGEWVVCDRFTDATFAYQAYGRQLGVERIAKLARWVHLSFAPDLTLWFDTPLAVAQARIESARGERDRIEAERAEFFERVRAGYAALAKSEPERIVQIDAAQPVEQVGEAVRLAVSAFIERGS